MSKPDSSRAARRPAFAHAGPVLEPKAAFRLIGIGGDDLQVMFGGIALDGRDLVAGRILLMLG